ncbi:MAG: FGGY-family carbohydrate kinase, partial [Spirochaetaceae bacterium]|nr:FGGY-family carbohydrate kinase [Spirochaetaceae bacterium]
AAGADGLPLLPALSWLDRRASAEAGEISALSEIPVDPTFYLPKALRLWRGSEELRRSVKWFFSLPEYFLFGLCGNALTYLPHPGYLPYIWDDSLIDALDMPRGIFPPFAKPGELAGSLTTEAARALGLKPGIPVAVGYPDFLASIVGSGAMKVGIACDRSGTSEALNICADRPFPGRELLSLPHAVDGLWNVSGGVSTAGAALGWISSILGLAAGAGDNGSDLVGRAALSPPGSRGLVFLPYLAGERAPLWNASRRGAFVGLGLGHGREDLARAVCESIAFGLRLAAEKARDALFPLRLARPSGSGASRDFLCSIKADALGIPFELPEVADCELVGDACACAAALGDATSIAEASKNLVRITRRIEPDRAASAALDEAYGSFKLALEALGPVDDRMHGSSRRASGAGG